MNSILTLTLVILTSLISLYDVYDIGSIQEPISSITNNKFIHDVLTRDISITRFDSLFKNGRVSYRIKPNCHSKLEQDTIFTFKSEFDHLKIYKTREKSLPMEFSLSSSKIVLASYVAVSMKKSEFLDFFNYQEFAEDKVIVRDLEGGNLFKFTFAEQILVKIEYLNTYLD